jgi:high-affinity nickel-transport protein
MSATDGPRNRPLTVGFWFSLGHSSVVFVLTLLLSAGATWLFRPEVHHYTALIGAGVSGTFLYLIAALNVVVLMGIVRVFAEMRQGRYDEEKLEQQLAGRGLLSRVFRRAMNAITKPWQMFPVGALFGLGFDTFTEVAFLLLAGSSVAFGLPWYAILCLPVLFAAGMSLLDTIDGVFMNLAYDWALARPIRKVYYNLTMTGLSVAVALLIGTVELVSVLGRQLGWSNGFYRWISRLDLNTLGYAIVALFAGTWAVAAMIWRFGRIEEKWAAGIVAPRPDPD